MPLPAGWASLVLGNSSLCTVTVPSESLAWASVPLPVGTVEPLGSEASDVTPPPRPVLPHVWVNEVQESEQLLSLLSQQSRPARLLCSLSDGQGEPHALDSYMELQIFFPVLLGIQPDSFMSIIGQASMVAFLFPCRARRPLPGKYSPTLHSHSVLRINYDPSSLLSHFGLKNDQNGLGPGGMMQRGEKCLFSWNIWAIRWSWNL